MVLLIWVALMNSSLKTWLMPIIVVLIAIWAWKQFGEKMLQKEPDRGVTATSAEGVPVVCRHNSISAECSCASTATGEKVRISYQECVKIAQNSR